MLGPIIPAALIRDARTGDRAVVAGRSQRRRRARPGNSQRCRVSPQLANAECRKQDETAHHGSPGRLCWCSVVLAAVDYARQAAEHETAASGLARTSTAAAVARGRRLAAVAYARPGRRRRSMDDHRWRWRRMHHHRRRCLPHRRRRRHRYASAAHERHAGGAPCCTVVTGGTWVMVPGGMPPPRLTKGGSCTTAPGDAATGPWLIVGGPTCPGAGGARNPGSR